LLGCSQRHDPQNAHEDVQSLITANDPRACAAPDAIQTALSAVDPKYGQALAEGMPEIRADAVSATGIDKDIHEITCSATGHAHSNAKDDVTFPMIYKLRPALDQGGGFVAEMDSAPAVSGITFWHRVWWETQKKGQAPSSDQSASSTDSPTSNLAAAGDPGPGPDSASTPPICNAEVLHEVTSNDTPSAKLKPGEAYDDVTQFWRNKKTGETYFCQHGGDCFPNYITLNGQKVEAIRLKNCSIGKDGDDQGDEILYPVG
jgi:hypothetical protein